MSNRIKNVAEEIISDQWATLKKVTYSYQNQDQSWSDVKREVYDRGYGACALLYNVKKQTVILIKQFRLPAYLAGDGGFLTEVPAGIIEDEAPEQAIIREIEEETGYVIPALTSVGDIFTSPGAVTERIFLFVAPYDDAQKVTEGGGLDIENEDIEVVEYAFAKALQDVKKGVIKDAKTIILLQHLALSGVMKTSNL